MSVQWNTDTSPRLDEVDDPDICALGTTQALDELEHELYGGMQLAAFAAVTALLTTIGIVVWLFWRFVL